MTKIPDEQENILKKLCAVLTALVCIAVCILPMADLPIWNGEIPGHRNQYELMAEAILDGRISFDYGDESSLSGLRNPYDPAERDETGVSYHWDHAYYQGKYYMYFGIVPVFLTFLPYRLLTGTALTTFHATQIFTAVSIAGIFTLFWMLRKLFFKKLPFGLYLILSAAFSVMSVWYATAEPALYCTAITSAIALEIWSIYFFVRAVYLEEKENRQILFAGIGALLGALVFGCRPPIALANIIVIPLLLVFLGQREFSWKLLGKLAIAASPYLVVGISLMIYNYVRFDDPFEFGQAYQLTVADQTKYSAAIDLFKLPVVINDTIGNFLTFTEINVRFPFIQGSSVFANFPILFLSWLILMPSVLIKTRKMKLYPLILGIFISELVITAMDVMWSPFLLERYRMDVYFLMGIGCFVTVGIWYETTSRKKLAAVCLSVLSVLAIYSSFLLYVQTVGVYYPDVVLQIAKALGV